MMSCTASPETPDTCRDKLLLIVVFGGLEVRPWAARQRGCFMATQEEVMIGHGHAAQRRSFLCRKRRAARLTCSPVRQTSRRVQQRQDDMQSSEASVLRRPVVLGHGGRSGRKRWTLPPSFGFWLISVPQTRADPEAEPSRRPTAAPGSSNLLSSCTIRTETERFPEQSSFRCCGRCWGCR